MTFLLSYGLSFLSITGVYVSLSSTSSLVIFDIFTATLTHGKSVTRESLTWDPRSSFLKCCNLAAIHFYRPIQLQFKRSMREQPDIHARLMSRYPQGK
jgi:hypothetical protein